MEQTLLNEIVARVAAKLAEAEGGEAAPAAADRDDREGLLLLSQEMNDTCRAMLKCEKLKARFRVDCASLQSEPAELDSYGVVVLTGLTNEALAKLALGLCDTPYTRLAAQAILTGKRVYVPTEEVELYRYASTAPAAYYAMMKERLDLLLTSGVVVCSKHNLEGLLLGGAAGFVPLKDAGVIEHVAKHHADLLVQDVDGVVGRKLVGAAGKDVLGPCGVAAAKVVALERAGKVVAGIGLGCQQVLADSVKLGNQARRKNSQAHDLDQADVLLFNMVILGMRVEYAQRMLIGRDVAAKRQVGLVDLAAGVAARVDAADDGRHGVVRHAIGCVRDNAHGLIGPLAPGEDNLLGGVEQLGSVVRAQSQHRERPLQHSAADLVKAGHAKLRDLGGMHHGELVRAALEVVVRQNRAAHDGQVGVGANEVVREQVDKVEQASQTLAVDVHRTMLGAHGNAVLVKVRIRAVLEAPALAIKLNGNNAQVLTGGMSAAVGCSGASGVALVLDAELTGGILLARVFGGTGRGYIARVLFGL